MKDKIDILTGNNANTLLYNVFKALSVEPTQEEINVTMNIINSGKVNNTDRASAICGYFAKWELENTIFAILETRWL